MVRVLVISTSRDEQWSMENALAEQPAIVPPGFGSLLIDTTASFGQDESWWLTTGPDCLVVHMPTDEQLQEFYLEKIRSDLPSILPLIIYSEVLSMEVMQLSQNFQKIRVLKSPVDGETLLRSVIELVTDWGDGQRQMHPRYPVDVDVEIAVDGKRKSFSGIMKNLSITGAYIEVDATLPEFLKDDLLKVTVELGKSPRQYIYESKVVWSKVLETGGFGYGLSFLNKMEATAKKGKKGS